MRKSQWAEALIALIIAMMLYAGITKLADTALFAFQMQRSPIAIVNGHAHLLSWLLPTFEIAIAAAMLIRRYRTVALWAFVSLMIVFTGYITYLLAAGLRLPCTCGGFISRLTWDQHLVFNICFIIMGLLAIVWQRPRVQHITAVSGASLPRSNGESFNHS